MLWRHISHIVLRSREVWKGQVCGRLVSEAVINTVRLYDSLIHYLREIFPYNKSVSMQILGHWDILKHLV